MNSLNQFQTRKGSVPVRFATGKITLWLGWRGSKFIVIATVKFFCELAAWGLALWKAVINKEAALLWQRVS